jgi:hypothetical protein
MFCRLPCFVIAAACAMALTRLAFGIAPGQIDNFQNGSTNGWTDGHGGTNVANVATGGPAGAGDKYLQVSSGSFDSVSRLITFNQSQWLGNYVAAKVVGLKMDLKNFGTSAVPIRIAIREGPSGPSTPGYASTTAFNLPVDGQWHKAVFFSLTAGTLTPINGPQPLATDLTSVKDFRLLSSSSPSILGDVINARIGVDNISPILLGDLNFSGTRSAADISAMLVALVDINNFKTVNHLSNTDLLAIGDVNGDGKITNTDIQALITSLKAGGGSVAAVPEPASIWLLALALPWFAFAAIRRRSSDTHSNLN